MPSYENFGVLKQEFAAGLPEYLKEFWDWDFSSFHSPAWWRAHWEKSGTVDIEYADTLPDGWVYWLKWLEAAKIAGYPQDEKEAEMLRVDKGLNLGFTRLVARKRLAR